MERSKRLNYILNIFIALGSPVNAEIFAQPVLSASHKSILFPEQLYA